MSTCAIDRRPRAVGRRRPRGTEEIVGEITDEHDPETQQPPEPDDGIRVMAGSVHVTRWERALEVDLPRGDYETIACLTIAQFGSLPEPGTTVEVPLPPDPAGLVHRDGPWPTNLIVEVLEVEQYVPATVRLTLAATGGHRIIGVLTLADVLRRPLPEDETA